MNYISILTSIKRFGNRFAYRLHVKGNSMRCYHFNNMYLAGIHAGIQSAHAQQELTIKYLLDEARSHTEEAKQNYIEWTQSHKTMCVLNGGGSSDLRGWIEFLSQAENTLYSWAPFSESEGALDGALTNIALVLPEKMYRFNAQIAEMLRDSRLSPIIVRVEDTTYATVSINSKREGKVVISGGDQFVPVIYYTKYEVELIERMSRLKLMS